MSTMADFYAPDEAPDFRDPTPEEEMEYEQPDPDPTSEQWQEMLLVEMHHTLAEILGFIRKTARSPEEDEKWTQLWRRLDFPYFGWREKLEEERWLEAKRQSAEIDRLMESPDFVDPFADD